MTVPLSLIRRQNHAAALAAIGINNDTRFPTITQCPKCYKTALHVFADDPADGLWLSCEDCKTAGNIVTFAAQVWNIGILDAVKQFLSQGLISEDEASWGAAIADKAFNKAKAADAFWHTARAQTWDHDDDVISVKLKELGITDNLPGMEEFVGVASWQQVVELCSVFEVEQPRKWRNGSAFLTFKFADMPARISGFLFVQYNEEFQARHIFIPTYGHRRNNKAEAGYYLLDNAFLRDENLHNCVFVVDDLLWVLNAQIVQIKYGLNPLPICASYHTDKITSTGRNWSAFPYAPRFFYSEQSPANAISQACLSKGYVCLPLTKPENFRRSQPNKTVFKLATIRKLSAPWKTALKDLVENANVMQARAIGQRMHIPHEKMRLFCDTQNIPAHIAEQLLAETIATPTGQLASQQLVVEKDGRWFAVNGRHVADGIIRITDVFQNDTGDQIYRGYAEIQNQKIEFTETEKIISRMGLLAYVRYKAGQRGILFVFDKQWNGRALMMAMQLARPRFVQISDKIGWCDEAGEFRFPNYAITKTGEIAPREYAGDKHKPFPEPSVAAPLTINNVLTPAYEHAAIWSGIAAIISNIIAPISNKNFMAVAVTNAAYIDVLAQIGQQLDCQHKKLLGLSGVINIAKTATWPFVIDAPYDRKRLVDTIVRHQQAPILLKTYCATAVAATTYGWNALNVDVLVGREDLSFLPYLLPAYVQHVLRKRMTLTLNGNFMAAVLRDLHTWLQDNYGGTFNLSQAEEHLWLPDRAPELLMTFLSAEIANGDIDVLPRPRNKEQPQNYVLKNDKYWWINEQALNRRFVEKCGLTPNWSFVRNTLDTLNVFLGQNTVQNMAGFNVKPEWANAFVFRENRKIG